MSDVEAVVGEVEGEPRWLCPWALPVGPPDREAVRAVCVWSDPHPDDVEHIAIVDDLPVLFGTDLGEKREATS